MRASHFAFFMNVPTLVCLGLVLAYPVVYAAYLSVHRVGLAQLRRGEFPFNGLENYSRVLEDPLFWVAIKNTLVFTVITVGSEIVLAVAIALLINQTSVWTSRVTPPVRSDSTTVRRNPSGARRKPSGSRLS